MLATTVAVVFILSGVTKLWRPRPTALAIVDFGLLTQVSLRAAIGVGLSEVLLGLWIVSELRVRLALTVASVLLLFFVALIGTALARGESFACACFGDSEKALSWWTLARTSALLVCAIAAAVVVPGGPAVGRVTLSDVALWFVAAALVGVVSLLSLVPGLLSWNRDPYSIGIAK